MESALPALPSRIALLHPPPPLDIFVTARLASRHNIIPEMRRQTMRVIRRRDGKRTRRH